MRFAIRDLFGLFATQRRLPAGKHASRCACASQPREAKDEPPRPRHRLGDDYELTAAIVHAAAEVHDRDLLANRGQDRARNTGAIQSDRVEVVGEHNQRGKRRIDECFPQDWLGKRRIGEDLVPFPAEKPDDFISRLPMSELPLPRRLQL